jgi:hypothetical protein
MAMDGPGLGARQIPCSFPKVISRSDLARQLATFWRIVSVSK